MKIDIRVVLVSLLLCCAAALPLVRRLIPEAAAKGSHSHESRYQCPMHPTVVQDAEGSCPICGMNLVALTARGNADVACRSVWATFGDGTSALIFHGVLAPDDQTKTYLPGGTRNIQRIDFDCLSVDRGHAIVDVDANVTALPTYSVPVG